MYQRHNNISGLLAEAEKQVIVNDRELYKPFLAAAEEYCRDHNLIVGGSPGIDMLLGVPLHRDSYSIDIYADQAYDTAVDLGNILTRTKSPHIDARLVEVQTNIRHRELTVLVNTRPLIKVYSLERVGGVTFSTVIKPVMCRARFLGGDTMIGVMPREIQLVEICHTLYLANRAGRWASTLDIYMQLSEAASATGAIGDEAGPTIGGAENLREISKKFTARALRGIDHINVGPAAVQIYTGETDSYTQIVTSVEPKEVADALAKLVPKSIQVNVVRYSLGLPYDLQLSKHTIYVGNNTKQVKVMDVYNSSQYEVLPVVRRDGLVFGAPFVTLRFLLIDAWVAQIIDARAGPSTDRGRSSGRGVAVSRLIAAMHKYIRSAILEGRHSDIFVRDYVGVYINEAVARKKFIFARGGPPPSHYPAITAASPSDTPADGPQ